MPDHALQFIAVQFADAATRDADDGILLVPIFIWMGFAQELLVVAAAVIPVVTLFFMVMYRKKQKTTGRKK